MKLQFAVFYEALAAIGYLPSEVDQMEIWQAARLLGADDTAPTIVGSRGLTLKSDNDDNKPGPGGANMSKPLRSTLARAKMNPESRGSSSLSGEDW